MPVYDPVNHEVLPVKLTECLPHADHFSWCRDAHPLDLGQRRCDALHGGVYTFSELKQVCKHYSHVEVLHYFRYECDPYETPKAEERRVDPADGQVRTFKELTRDSSASYNLNELQFYWNETCVPHAEKCSNQGLSNGTYSNSLVFGDPTCEADRCAKVITSMGKEAARTTSSPNNELVSMENGGRAIDALNVAEKSNNVGLRKWLLDVDDGGHLLKYYSAMAARFDTIDTLLAECDVSVRALETSESREYRNTCRCPPWLGEFLDKAGVMKVGHRRLFERWFQKYVSDRQAGLVHLESCQSR